MRLFRQRLGDRIVAARAPWAATADPGNAQPAAGPKAVLLDGLVRIIGTGRQMPAGPAHQRRQRQLVAADQDMREKTEHSAGNSPFSALYNAYCPKC